MIEDRSTTKTNLMRTGLWFVAVAGILFDAYYIIYTLATPLLFRWQFSVAQAAANAASNNAAPVNAQYISAVVDNMLTPLMLIVGLIAVAFSVASEYYLRRGERQGKLMHHALVVFISIIGVFAACFLILQIVTTLVPLPV